MEIYRVRKLDIDGGVTGRVWQYWHYAERDDAESKMVEIVLHHNRYEKSRSGAWIVEEQERCRSEGRPWPRLYHKGVVDGIAGWVNWQYSTMLVLDIVNVL